MLEHGPEYLIGVMTLPEGDQHDPKYEGLWSFTGAEEKNAFECFIQDVMERWRTHPEMHIYDYAPYEPTAIKRLAGRHGTCIAEVDSLLRAAVFVDLFRVVRQGLRASVESYSIKRLEPLYGFERSVPLTEANSALQCLEATLALGDSRDEIQSLLDSIQGYNRDDCVSAWRLRNWLEERRKELEETSGQTLPLTGVAFILPSFLMVLGLASLYVHFGQLAWIQGMFYGIGAAVSAIIVRTAWKLIQKTLAKDFLLWGLFGVLALTTVWTQSEIIWLFVLSGFVALFAKATPKVRAKPTEAAALVVPGLVTGLLGPASAGTLASLFLYFLKAGAFVFGSGLAIVPFLYGGVVGKFHWLTEHQFLDAVAVAMITPGPIVITSGFIGFLVAGPLGACASATWTVCSAASSVKYAFTVATETSRRVTETSAVARL